MERGIVTGIALLAGTAGACLWLGSCKIGRTAGAAHNTTPPAPPSHTQRSVPLVLAGVATRAEEYVPRSVGSHPAVVLLYGSGGMSAGGPAYRWYASTLADSGIVTIICPYFDATHGRQHREPANARIWVPAVRGCLTDLSRQRGVDRRRIGMMGFSLGGFVALSTTAEDHRV